jgi:hypothetical protein
MNVVEINRASDIVHVRDEDIVAKREQVHTNVGPGGKLNFKKFATMR